MTTQNRDFAADRAAFMADALAAEEAGDDERAFLGRSAYEAILPDRPISRSPFTDELVLIPFDDVGIDGFWWDALDPTRPGPAGGLPDGVISFTGAMELREPFASVPFLASPGPGVPFVHPELLGRDGVVAVVSQIDVGHHTGYPVLYFAPRVPEGAPLLDWWGARHHRYLVDGTLIAGENPGFEGDWDYDLLDWVRLEKLLWIAPGDESTTLRSGTEGCPYLDLEGDRRIARIQDGEMWRSTPGYF